MKLLYTIIFILITFISYGQNQEFSELDEEQSFGRWDLGLNFGLYLPSNYHAKFYDGSSDNVNNIDYVFGNKYWYQDIFNAVNAADTVLVAELPTNMRYRPSFQIGVYFRRTFDNYFGFSMQFDYSKLIATDKYTVQVDPDYIATEPDIRIYDIWGIEERINIDLLFSRYFELDNPMYMPFFEAGINLTSTKVKEHKIRIEDLEYSLVDVYLNGSYVPGMAQNEYEIYQGGIGFGFTAAAGIKLRFNNQISVDPGLRIYFQNVKLENYDLMKPAFAFFVRLGLADFFGDYE